ncbi:MAG: Rqc2 family fibronectin-binding protein [Thermoanaerobacteraceae bacterium]
MALDGITLFSIINELNKNLTDGKIDKIYQPEKEELILIIRNKGINYKLLISANPNYPRLYLTDLNKENPAEPPMFCMLMRKFIQGGKIMDIRQVSFDRIVEIDILGHDDLENQVLKTLIVEIMGRHSNIILIDSSTKIIIDSIKRIYNDMSKIREILPGRKYVYPPLQNKINLKTLSKDNFIETLKKLSNKKIEKAIVDTLEGFSPVLGREISFRSKTNDKYVSELNNDDLERIYKTIETIAYNINNFKFEPCVAFYNNEAIDFSCVKLTQYTDLYIFDTVNYAANKFFNEKANEENIRSRSHDLKKIIQNNLEKLYKKLDKIQIELYQAENADIYRLYGELITANIYKIKKGTDSFKTINYYDGQEIIIPLEKQYSPSQNAQRYFKKYNKAKTAINILKEQIKTTSEDINYLEGQLLNIENCTLPSEIEEIRNELRNQGFIRKKNKKINLKTPISKPMHIVSSDGYDIYIGKNNTQNDYLTLKLADPDDLWFHTKDIPGSHVIIKNKKNHITDTAILEAAKLAAKYSKAKNSSKVPVDYTFKKYVKKPSGSKPGFVIYTNQKTLYVTPDNK